MSIVRLGIVGTGFMAEERARAFGSISGVKITAVHTRNPEKAGMISGPAGAKVQIDYREFLSGVDAVILCGPNFLHARFAGEALAAGRHVLVEYPLCVSAEEAEELRAAAVDSGCVLMVGNTIIHEAMFGYISHNRRRLGRLVSASSRVSFYDKRFAGSWYLDGNKIGNIFIGFLYHHIEYYRNLFGDVAWVLGREESIPDERKAGSYIFRGGTMLMAHCGGGTACIQWYLSGEGSRSVHRGIWLNGSQASVAIVSDRDGKSLVVWDGKGETETYDDQWGVDGSCRDFIRAIKGELDHRARLESDLATLKVAFAAADSAVLGRTVSII